jgi:hypothetical protein
MSTTGISATNGAGTPYYKQLYQDARDRLEGVNDSYVGSPAAGLWFVDFWDLRQLNLSNLENELARLHGKYSKDEEMTDYDLGLLRQTLHHYSIYPYFIQYIRLHDR